MLFNGQLMKVKHCKPALCEEPAESVHGLP